MTPDKPSLIYFRSISFSIDIAITHSTLTPDHTI